MTEKVKKQILSIRASGETNMFDIQAVKQIARREKHDELLKYLEGRIEDYAHFILTGEEKT
jgi:hypothetical protein